MILETERLILRPWTPNDAEDLYRYASDPRIGPSAGWCVHSSLEESRQVIESVLAVPETYAVTLRETGECVGSIGLIFCREGLDFLPPDEPEIGYWIGAPFWGQGLIPEAVRALQRYAFETLGCPALWCGYFEGNEKSRRVQEKCGFRPERIEESVCYPQLEKSFREHFTRLTRAQWDAAQR